MKKKLLFKILPVFILTISIPAAIIVLFSYNSTKNLFKADIISNKKTMNTQIARAIDVDLKGLEKQSEALIINFSDMKDLLAYTNDTIDEKYSAISDKVRYYLLSILKNNEQSNGIGLINIYGSMLLYTNYGTLNPNYDKVIKDDWVRQTYLAKGNPLNFILDLNNYTVNGTQPTNKVIAVTRAIMNYTNDNIPIGISIFVQNLENFGQTVIKDKISEGDTILILDKNNAMVFSNNTVPDSLYSGIIKVLAGEVSAAEYMTTVEKNLLLCNFSSAYGFKVISIIPEKAIEDKLSGIQKINLILVLLLSTTVILLSVFLSRLIVTPLKRLMISFKHFEYGDFEVRTPVKGEDEFAEICKGFNSMVSNLKGLIREKYEMDIHLKQAELESLQSKINPHFLYNTLSSMKSIIEKNDFQNAYSMVQNLSDIFRYSLSKGRFIVSFAEELDHIGKYLWIQKFRFGNRYTVAYDIDQEALNCPILRITLQPIVENSLVHGFEGKDGTGRISISAKVFREICNIYVIDDGAGIPSEKLEEIGRLLKEAPEIDMNSASGNLIGIFNVNTRIKLYFGASYGVTITSTVGKGTTVRIAIPSADAGKGVIIHENFGG